jgi:dihydroorotase
MTNREAAFVLKGGYLVDPSQNIDRVIDIVVADGKILGLGPEAVASAPADAETIDLSGHYASPGWFDIHIHAYGTLGFANPDSIGIKQGVTSYVDAGGPGIGVMDEFAALLEGQTITDLYAGPYIRPMGIIGAQFIEGDIRSLMNFPVTQWVDFMADHPGLVRYLKVAALGTYGTGPLKMAKGLAEIIGVPLYGHIGEYQHQPADPCVYEIFNISQAGDIITHVYHANDGPVLDDDGKVFPVVRDAMRRGVIFDVGFGAFNFGWDLAEKCFEQDLRPHIISSDLQQFNVLGPVKSLANILGIFLHLGMSVYEVIETITNVPAKVLGLEETVGSLAPGMPADITVFDIEDGDFESLDTYAVTRQIERRFLPVLAFKDGVRHEIDMDLCQNDRNWMMQIAEDHIPEAAEALTGRQREFLGMLRTALEPYEWKFVLEDIDLSMATTLQGVFTETTKRAGLPLRDGLMALYGTFLDSPFTLQSGLLLLQVNRDLAMARLEAVAGDRQAAA